MPDRTGNAVWEGSLREGKGTLALGSGAFKGQYSFSSRFEEGTGTNPEELIGAAHAACFSMALSGGLGRAGFTPQRVSTTATVKLAQGESGFRISRIILDCEAQVPGIDDATFQQEAEKAKKGCPVSQALAATEIELRARLAS
ncbi:MAG: OsmC family protein [Hyphomicrobiales bacterium]